MLKLKNIIPIQNYITGLFPLLSLPPRHHPFLTLHFHKFTSIKMEAHRVEFDDKDSRAVAKENTMMAQFIIMNYLCTLLRNLHISNLRVPQQASAVLMLKLREANSQVDTIKVEYIPDSKTYIVISILKGVESELFSFHTSRDEVISKVIELSSFS